MRLVMCGEWVFEAIVLGGVDDNGRAKERMRGVLYVGGRGGLG